MRPGKGVPPGKRGIEVLHTNKFEHGPEFQRLRLTDAPGTLYRKDKVIKVVDRKGNALKFRLLSDVLFPEEGVVEVLTQRITS